MASRVEHLAEGVTVYCGDCREILPTLGVVDAIVTDPPYSVSVEGSAHVGRKGKGSRRLDFFAGDADWQKMTAVVAEAAALAIARLKATGSMYWWCGHRQFNSLTTLFEDEGFSTRFLVWSKLCPSPAPPGSGWPSAAELCLYAYKAGRTFNGSPRSNVIVADSYRFGQPGKVDHPTQKPFPTIEPLILASTSVGDVVLDPFTGSGTTGVLCVRNGRQFVGCELEPKYFDIACRRIADEVARPRMFSPSEPAPAVQEALFA